jgi:hypothetical protein
MNLTKKQVKALLEVLSKDDTRPILEHALIDDYQGQLTLVATDSYKLIALKLHITSADGQEYIGKLVSRDDLTRWYKLAATKDTLMTNDLLAMAAASDMNYPKWQDLLKEKTASGNGRTDQDLKPEAVSKIGFQADYAVTLEKLAGTQLFYEFHGPFGAMLARTDDGLFILMPLKEGRRR